jgi:formylglycine-generating enzyme required for sulfatase activity
MIPRERPARLALLRRGLIPWLAGIDSETGAPRRRVARLSEVPVEARPLVELLVEQRLLATDVAADNGEATVEPAHEALLRQWDLLNGWLIEDTAFLSVLEGVKRAAREWVANDRGPAWLAHASQRLVDAERLRERPDLSSNLEPADRDYLTACRESESASRKKTRRMQVVLILLLVGFGLVVESMLWANRIGLSAAATAEGTATAVFQRWTYKFGAQPPLPQLAAIPAGKFEMKGKEVLITEPFYLGATEVTFEQFDAFVIATAGDNAPEATFGRGDDGAMPVINVNFDAANAYAKWLGEITGNSCTLPSEIEWEYACRAGTRTKFGLPNPDGSDDISGKEIANCQDCGSEESSAPTVVKSFDSNSWGLYDMHGNIMEWTRCADETGAKCASRVIRSGAWSYRASQSRCDSRARFPPQHQNNFVGFRVLCSGPIAEH